MKLRGNHYRRFKYQDLFVENQKEVLIFGIELEVEVTKSLRLELVIICWLIDTRFEGSSSPILFHD